jgi:hypothetical protein
LLLCLAVPGASLAQPSKWQTQDATACVQVVGGYVGRKTARCSGGGDVCVYNGCASKVSFLIWGVAKRLEGGDQVEPGQTKMLYTVGIVPWERNERYEYRACTWAPGAPYGPQMKPNCRYIEAETEARQKAQEEEQKRRAEENRQRKAASDRQARLNQQQDEAARENERINQQRALEAQRQQQARQAQQQQKLQQRQQGVVQLGDALTQALEKKAEREAAEQAARDAETPEQRSARLEAEQRQEAARRDPANFRWFEKTSNLSGILKADSSALTLSPMVTTSLPIAIVWDVLSLPSKTTDYRNLSDKAAFLPSQWAHPDSMIAKAAAQDNR